MLELISDGFRKAQDILQGKVVIQEKHIEDAVKEIRLSLLEADVEFHVVKEFIDHVKEKALGEIVHTKVAHGGKKMKVSPRTTSSRSATTNSWDSWGRWTPP